MQHTRQRRRQHTLRPLLRVSAITLRVPQQLAGARAMLAGLNLSLVTPIYKRGSVADVGNYRPNAISNALICLCAVLLKQRLIAYTEAAQLRAPMQAGFRPHLSTVHQLLALQHLAEHARGGARPQAASWT